MIRTSALLATLALSACSGAALTSIMPGESITVNGNAFTVRETSDGVTVQNFETGRTSPAVLIVNAGLAAERVTGCTVTGIVKDGITNTYYATTTCPNT